MRKNIDSRKLKLTLFIVLITIVLLIAVIFTVVYFSLQNKNNAVASRVYSINPWNSGRMISVDLNSKGQLLAIRSPNYYLGLDESWETNNVDITYDSLGKMTGVSFYWGDMTVTKYDPQGRATEARGEYEYEDREDTPSIITMLKVTYNSDGGSTWSFDAYQSDLTESDAATIFGYTFDKYWRCIDARVTGKEDPLVDVSENTVTVTGESQITAKYTDNNKLSSLLIGNIEIKYELDDNGFCTRAGIEGIDYKYTYDKDHNLIGSSYSLLDKLIKEELYEYDDLNREIKKSTLNYNSDNGVLQEKVVLTTEYHGFDNVKKRTSRVCYINDRFYSSEVAEYNKSGIKIEQTSESFYENGNKEYYNYQRYYESGTPIEIVIRFYYENGKKKTEDVSYYYEFWKQKSSEYIKYYENGDMKEYSKKTFDEEGNLIEQTNAVYDEPNIETQKPKDTDSETKVIETEESETVLQ